LLDIHSVVFIFFFQVSFWFLQWDAVLHFLQASECFLAAHVELSLPHCFCHNKKQYVCRTLRRICTVVL